MADKFGITAELLLVLDSKIESTVDDLKQRINKKPSTLKLNVDPSDIKNVYKEVGALQKSFRNKPLNIGLRIKPEDIKTVYKEINSIKRSLDGKPLKIRFDSSNIESATKNILANINSVKQSLKSKPINANVGINSDLLHAEIKKVYKEINALKTSLNSPMKFTVQAINDEEIVRVANLIKDLRSKNLSIGLNLRKGTLDNFQKLNTAVSSLNSQVSGFNLTQFDSIASRTRLIAKSIASLSKINGKKITFDLSLKDIKNVDKLEDGLNRVAIAFNKAKTSGIGFNSVIRALASAVSSLQTGLSGLNLSNISAAAKSIKTLSSKSSIAAQNTLTSSIRGSRDALYDLGLQSGITLKRFGAYTLVTAGFFRLSFAIRNAISEFIDFDKQLTKIRQVTGQSVENTAALGDEVGRLATKYGVSSLSILNTSQVLAQAGFSTHQVREALEALTKTEIAATFENIENTVEGAVAAMAQFGLKTSDLDATLSSINAVSAAFAVESSDITTAIQKAGGAFASAGGSLNELIGLFTTVRSTTRESADTVAVGIRTITTRLQRLSTSKFLADFGINIRRTAEEVREFQDQFGRNPDFKAGDFVGAFEALKRISQETAKIGGADPRIAQIAEELAGFRQINKIIPLLRSFEVSQNAIQVALAGTDSLTKDAAIAQESYANQLTKVREEFQLMIREFAQDESIKSLITDILDLTKFTIKLAASFKDLLEPLLILGALKIGSSSGPFIKGFKDSFLAKKDGGYIPGIGNKDSQLIAAMPGEFVVKKRAAKKLGPSRLNMINEGIVPAFAAGGLVGKSISKTGLGVAGITAASYAGLFGEFSKLEDTTKENVIGLAGLATQILFVIGTVKAFGSELDKASLFASKIFSRKTIDSPRILSQDNNRTPALQRLFDQDETKKIALSRKNEKSVFKNSRALSNKTSSKALEELIKKQELNKVLSRVTSPDGIAKLSDEDVYNKIPQKVREQLEKAGVTRVNAEKITDVYPQLKGQMSQGSKKVSYDNVPGVYDPNQKRVVVSTQRPRLQQADTALHEFGHAFDYTSQGGKLSDDKEFARRRKQDIKNLRKRKDITKQQREALKYYTQGGKADKRGREETFAQSFSSVVARGKQKDSGFARFFPLSTSFVSDKIGPTQPDLIREDIAKSQKRSSYLESLQRVPQGATRIGQIEGSRFAANQQVITSRIAKKFNLQDPRAIPNSIVRSGVGAFGYSSLNQTNRNGAVKSLFGIGSGGPPNKPPLRERLFGSGGSDPNNPSRNRFSKFSSKLGGGSGIGIGIAAGFIGDFIGDQIKKSSQRTDTKQGSRSGFALGGAISGASSAGAIGAGIGTLIAPGIGTAVGAALGGVYGATTGVIGSLKEFDNQLATVSSNKSIESLGKIFDSIKEEKTTSQTSAFDVTSNVRNLQRNLQSTSDPSIRENILGELGNQKVNLANFVGDISKISNSYENFTQRVDDGTQRMIAGILGIPFSDFKENIEKDIKAATEFDNAFQKGVKTIREFDNNVKSILRFSEAFTIASQRVNTFTSNLQSFASGSSGSTSLKNSVSPALDIVETGISTKGLEKQVLDFTGQFGKAGKTLGKTASDIIKASNILPDILSNLRSGSALDDTGAVTERFAESLKSAGIGKSVSNLIIQRVEDLLGSDNKDPEFFKNLSKDPQKALQTLLEGTKPALDAISSAYETSTTKLNEFSASLENLRGFDKTILEGITKVAQNRSSLIQARGTFTGKNVDSQLLANERDITRINTGGLSVGRLQAGVSQRKSNIQGLTTQLNDTEDIQLRARIQVALENERSALEKTTSALSYLANTTSELSILQQQLNRAQSERLSKRDFALDFASSTGEEQNRLSSTVRGARSAAATGSLSGTPQDLKKDVISFLKTYADSVVGSGKTGKEVLDSIANNTTGLPQGFQNTGSPSKQENSIQAQIEASLNTQKEAQQAINTSLITDRQQFSQQLNKDMQTFFSDLKNILAEGQTRDIRNQIGTTSGRLQDTIQKRNSLSGITGRFGENALVNAPDIKAVNEDINKFGSVPNVVSGILQKLEGEKGLALKENDSFTRLSGPVRSSISDFDKRAGSLVQSLSPDQLDKVRQDLQKGDIGRKEDGTIAVSKAFEVLKKSLTEIRGEATTKLLSANDKRTSLISQVGGTKNFEAISKDVESKDSILLKSLNDFPKDTSIGSLNSEINNLRGQLEALNTTFKNSGVNRMPIRRNSGGIVPGFGNTDSIPALLTPGEFVLSKPAVRKIGIQTLKRTNSGAKRYASGGLVQSNPIIDTEVVSKFNLAVNQLGIQIQNMRDAISKIPTEITMNGTHRVDVYLNGAQVLTQIKPEIAALIQSEIKNGINKLIKTKMPNLGNFEG